MAANEEHARSSSRGREFTSSGRGGAGNIRRSSASRDAARVDGPDDFSPVRGREPAIVASDNKIFSTGRGGAGNIRSRSRQGDGSVPPTTRENEILHRHAEAEKDAIHSSGRGGLGNMSGSRSRSRGPSAFGAVRSTGRGGAGNMTHGDYPNEHLDEEERKLYAHTDGIHSTGRGGIANLTGTSSPGVEHHDHRRGIFESTGRGGAGNISRDRSTDPEGRNPSRGRDKESRGVAGLWNRVTGSRGPDSRIAHQEGITDIPEEGERGRPI